MSRATSIWLIYGTDGAVVSAFTVKHEMLSWLQRVEREDGISVTSWRIEQRKDGPWGLRYNPDQEHDYMKDNWARTIDVKSLL